ncbi:ATP-binding protein [Thermococcus sp. MV5]|uniref:ATP-binding protein n=1 Tax=Thermococcus sp. MV5 TaxID=1638272 RepID=UPI00143BA1EB|nr:ATP-binding protein [Thermococcus sp. MV5]NJE25508.1 ATP-binding protein [Thermococcus sp. MV5]
MLDKDSTLQHILDFQEKNLPELINRELTIPMKREYVISIIGPRRAGKTFYFYQLIKSLPRENVVYIDFEHPVFDGFKAEDIGDVLKLHREAVGEPIYIFLDEVQNVPKWEKAVRYLHDEGYHVLITGSSSKLLSKEIATALRGRALKYTLLPFSFREFLMAKGFVYRKYLSSKKEAEVKALLREYLTWGGFPRVVLENEERIKEKILMEYLDMIVYKDIIERHNIRNLHVVKLLIRSLMRSFSKEFSVHSFYNSLKSQGIKVSKGILYEYLSYMEDAMTIFLLKKFSYSIKTSELSIPKIYPVDTGLAKVFSFTSDIGRLMELVVFLELKRREKGVYYYKGQKEVDFIVTEREKPVELVQVTYAMDSNDVKPREIDAIETAGEKINVDQKTVITWDYEDERSGIRFIPLWKWLIEAD